MAESDRIAAEINIHIGTLKSGARRIFGEWFDKPGDVTLRVTGAAAHGDLLAVSFDAAEPLRIWSPGGYQGDSDVFVISTASRVLLQAYSAGRPRTQENLLYVDYVASEGDVRGTTNITWFDPFRNVRKDFPAVQLW